MNFSELEKKYIKKKEYINETKQDDPSPSQKHLPLSHYIDLTRIDSLAIETKLTIPALKSDTLHPSPHSSTLQNSFESIVLTPPPPNTNSHI